MEFLSQTMNRAFITSSVIGLYSELRIAVFWRVDKRINSDGSDKGRVGTCVEDRASLKYLEVILFFKSSCLIYSVNRFWFFD